MAENEGLAKLIDESVPETALLLFREASRFQVRVDGEMLYAGLLLPVERIGGLDKKASRSDPDKGQFLECIKNDTLQVYMTPELLDTGKILFIPTFETLSGMDEYGFLRAATYILATVSNDGAVQATDWELTLPQALSVAMEDLTLAEVLGIEEEEKEDTEEDTAEDSAKETPSELPTESNDEDTPFDGGEDVDTTADTEVTYDDIPDAPPDEADPEEDTEEPVEETSEKSAEGPVYKEDVDESQVRAAVSRRFYSDELGLEVTSAPFDAQFAHTTPPPALSEDYDEEWQGSYLRMSAKDANLELARMRENTVSRLREDYFNLVARSCEDIQRMLDMNDPQTAYGKRLRKLDAKRDEYLDSVSEEIEKQKAELEAAYAKKREQYVENAVAAAKQQYDNMYGRQHAAQLAALNAAAYNRIEAGYQEQRRQLLERRREEAGKLLDYRISDIMQVLTEEYHRRLEEEDARYQQLRQLMQENRERHRADLEQMRNAYDTLGYDAGDEGAYDDDFANLVDDGSYGAEYGGAGPMLEKKLAQDGGEEDTED